MAAQLVFCHNIKLVINTERKSYVEFIGDIHWLVFNVLCMCDCFILLTVGYSEMYNDVGH